MISPSTLFAKAVAKGVLPLAVGPIIVIKSDKLMKFVFELL